MARFWRWRENRAWRRVRQFNRWWMRLADEREQGGR